MLSNGWLTITHHRDSIAGINKVLADKNIKLERSTELSTMDDESYGAKSELKPLPQCEKVISSSQVLYGLYRVK